MKNSLLLLVLIIFFLTSEHVNAQYQQVTTYSGVQTIGGVTVNISHSVNGVYGFPVNFCMTGPYHVGIYDIPGSFTFKFSTPVTGIRVETTSMDFLDNLGFNINGTFYPLTNANLTPPPAVCPQAGCIIQNGVLFAPIQVTGGIGGTVTINPCNTLIDSVTVYTTMGDSSYGTTFNFYFTTSNLGGGGPVVVAGNNGPVCLNQTLNLTASNVGGGAYSWTGPNGFTSGLQNPSLQNVTLNMAGTYVVTVADSCGTATDSTTVSIISQPVISSTSFTHPTCNGNDGSITLNGLPPNGTYSVSYHKNGILQGPVTLTAANNGSLVLSSLSAGIYSSIVVGIGGCTSNPSGPFTLANPKLSAPAVSINSPVCEGGTLVLTATSGSGAIFSWTGPNGFTSGQQSPTIQNVTAASAGLYTVTTTLNACTSPPVTVQVQVISIMSPNVITSRDTICSGDTVIIYGLMNASATANWNFNGGTVLSGSGIGPYVVRWDNFGSKTVTLTIADSGCSKTTTKDIFVAPSVEPQFYLSDNACAGDTIIVKAVPGGTDSLIYTWSFGDADIISGSGAGPYALSWDSAGTKTVSLFIVGNCSAPYIDSVVIHQVPDVKIISPGHDVCKGDTVTLEATDNSDEYAYEWMPGKNVVSKNESQVSIRIPSAMFVYLTVSDNYGCQSRDSVYVKAESCCRVFLPNAFSPNGDGVNDKIHPLTRGIDGFKFFLIVNRFGQVVFQTYNPNIGWDGTFNGSRQDMGTYYYYLSYGCDGKWLEQEGDIFLLR
jgi:gliding motility-associated-like protein